MNIFRINYQHLVSETFNYFSRKIIAIEIHFISNFTCFEHLLPNPIKSYNSLIYLDAHTSSTR